MSKKNIRMYNKVIMRIAEDHTEHLGINTMRSRVAMAHWCRRLRREYPYSKMMQQQAVETLQKAPRSSCGGFQGVRKGVAYGS